MTTIADLRYHKTGPSTYIGTLLSPPHMRHTPVSHEFQCRWQIERIRDGKVTWRCTTCRDRQSRHVRVHGVLPPALLFKSNWPYGIIGCSLCATILNAKAANCKGLWHQDNREKR